MSKNYPENEVDVNALTQEELTAIANDDAETETPAPKKRVFSRILAVLLALAPIALVCFLPVSLFLYDKGYEFFDLTLLKVFTNIFKQNGVQAVYEAAGVSKASIPANIGTYAFHSVPLLNAAGSYGKVFSWFIYAFPAVFLLNIIFMLVAVFSGKKAPAMVRAISFMDMLLFGGYAILTLFLSALWANKLVYDIVVVSCAGAGVLFFAAYTIGKRKGKVTLPLVLLILTLAFVGAYAFAIFKYDLRAQLLAWYKVEDVIAGKFTWGTLLQYVVRGLIGLYALAILISVIRLSSKKGYGFDIFRYSLHLVLALAVLYPCFFDMPFTSFNEKTAFVNLKWFAVAAAGIALLQMIICIIAKHAIKAKEAAYIEDDEDEEATEELAEKEEADEQPAEAAGTSVAAKAATEAVAEEKAVPAENDEAKTAPFWMNSVQSQPETPAPEPVEENEQLVIPNFSSFRDDTEELDETPAPTIIPVAQPVAASEESRISSSANSSAPAAAPVAPAAPATAAYDYYNTKSFDPFIASLNEKEREQFTDLFILKYQGVMNHLPDYVVGGDNSEFFRKVFIYLGQYRERIPDALLAKMYKFCVKR